MENEQISKKELLEITGISYGQLYRWKRKNLIPEDWFIKKSSFTGQETYFPRDQILARINKIKNMKDELPLDDIADVFSPEMVEFSLKREDLEKQNFISIAGIDLFIETFGVQEIFNFKMILFIFILNKMLKSGNVNREEGKTVLQILSDNLEKIEEKNIELIALRKMGIFICVLITNPCEILFDLNTRVVDRVNINSCIEELKTNLNIKEV
jgi:DNA-binding transcriptional MerR regulator